MTEKTSVALYEREGTTLTSHIECNRNFIMMLSAVRDKDAKSLVGIMIDLVILLYAG